MVLRTTRWTTRRVTHRGLRVDIHRPICLDHAAYSVARIFRTRGDTRGKEREMGFAAGASIRTWRLWAWALLAIAAVAATMSMVAAAQAHAPAVVKAWGRNQEGQLGNGANSGPEKCSPPENIS